MDAVDQELGVVAPPATTPRARPPLVSGELREALRYAGWVFLGVRVGLGLLALLGLSLLPANGTLLDRFEQVQEPGWGMLLGAWERWDAQYYLRIIDAGYPIGDARAAFFPLYPMLAWVVRPLVGGSSLAAALVVSNLAFFAALVVLYRLTVRERGGDSARRSVLYLAITPVAFFFLAPYTESLFLLLAVATFAAARDRRWVLAGLLAGLASAARPVGVLLAIPIALELTSALRAPGDGDRRGTLLRGLAGLALTPLGLVGYLGFWQLRAGDWRYPLSLQTAVWQREPTWPWQTLWEGLGEGTEGIARYPDGYAQVDLLVVVLALAALVWVLRALPLSYGLWTLACVLLPLLTPAPYRTFVSIPRLLLVVFPLIWALDRLVERYGGHSAVVAVSSGLLALLTVLHLTGYPVY